jgi:2-polyprenyl-3-methyl-5-hydroxy-6-metoxy-1,4-benzoquinol methylase
VYGQWPDFTVLSCDVCGFRYIDLEKWIYPYSERDYYQSLSEKDLVKVAPAWVDRRCDLIETHVHPGARCLDVGCGTGDVTIALRKRGFDAEGLDESSHVIELLRRVHPQFKLHQGAMDDMSQFGQYDLITLYHVLEHIPDPLAAMKKISHCLKPGGLIVVEVPNAGGLQARIMGKRWHHYLAHHVNYFLAQNFVKLGDESGLRIVDVVANYDFTYPTGAGWKVSIKRVLERFGFNDVITVIYQGVERVPVPHVCAQVSGVQNQQTNINN